MKKQPLKCSVEGDELVVRIGLDTLSFAAGHLSAVDSDNPKIIVSNAEKFAHDVANEMHREREDGSSPLTDLIDNACLEAFDQGSLGISEECFE